MYIKSVHIQNIRSITEFKMEFDEGKEAGWHVLIGENGSGKTTILRCLAFGIMGSGAFLSLRCSFQDYVDSPETDYGRRQIHLAVHRDLNTDELSSLPDALTERFPDQKSILQYYEKQTRITSRVSIGGYRENLFVPMYYEYDEAIAQPTGFHLTPLIDAENSGYFSCAFGSFRRFQGGNESWDSVYDSNPRTAAHMSLFGEDVALTQIEPWLIKLEHKRLRGENGHLLELIKILLNDRELLPDGTKLKDISPDGLIFQDANGADIHLHQLSDGFRSVLSLTMELIRQLIRVYGEEKTFENLEKQLKEGKNDDPAINYLPGVVLIDEVDAHLHPTWQTEIGQWFTRYFPKLQFIVTTHSPLICRACGDNGHIWHLRGPGSDEKSRKLEGAERDRLVFGDILDAYDTDLFGEDIERGKEGREKRDRYRELSYKQRYGVEMTEEEQKEFTRLNEIFRFNVEGNRSRVK